jgi:lipopolysaccharide/colanic/teichoic acid biosynthesis glycosyltransferase
MKQTGVRLRLKRALDRTVALVAMVVTAPVFGAAALGIRLTMGGPVLFSQQRPGRDRRPFRIFKLRTMTDARGPNGALLPDADRMTPLGHLLRSTSIDELPQLWNVLRGDLSLVGPRPLLMQYLPLYSPEQARRHDVLPGITGWAQVNGRNAVTWEEKLALDVWYVDNWSLSLDLRILARTALAVARRDGVANAGHVTMPVFRGSPRQATDGVGEGSA